MCVSATFFFFFNDTATTEIYTLSLHDALPISHDGAEHHGAFQVGGRQVARAREMRHEPAREGIARARDRKSTRLNSSHLGISYAVFCLKKKNRRQSGEDCLSLR